jgi:hypothetical protein
VISSKLQSKIESKIVKYPEDAIVVAVRSANQIAVSAGQRRTNTEKVPWVTPGEPTKVMAVPCKMRKAGGTRATTFIHDYPIYYGK